MSLFVVVLLAVFLACSVAHNASFSSPLGLSCSGYGKDGYESCKKTPELAARIHTAFTEIGKGLKAASHAGKTLTAQSGNVCSAVAPYMPSYCSCTNNAGGAVVNCPYTVVVGGSPIDTITITMTLEVCANPATIGIKMVDQASGITFSESITTGESGSIPTGISVGVPMVGDVEILLAYTMSGNIDQLYVKLGVDLQAVIMGWTEKCSQVYPNDCPVYFYEETINFGNFC